MKTTILFLLFTLPLFAQNGFKAEKGKIVWEHFYPETNAKFDSIVKRHEKIKVLSSDNVLYTGKAEGIKSTIDSNSVRLESDANFDFTITRVDGGYKVAVTNYTLLEKYGPLQMRIIPATLGKYYIDNGKIRPSVKTQTDLSYVDGFLTGLFAPQAAEPQIADVPVAAITTLTSK